LHGAEQGASSRNYRSKIGENEIQEAPPPTQGGKSNLVSVEDVLNTANLNDRMEMARLRHAQILALRGRSKPAGGGKEKEKSPGARKASVRFSLGGKRAAPVAVAPAAAPVAAMPAVPAVEKQPAAAFVAAPVVAAATAQPKKRRTAVLVAAAAVIILLVGLAVPGPFRDYAFGTANDAATDQTAKASDNASATTSVRPQIVAQIDPQTPAPKVDRLAGALLVSVSAPQADGRAQRAPFLSRQLPEPGPSPELGAAVPVFVARSGAVDPLTGSAAVKSTAPELLPRLVSVPRVPDIATLVAPNSVGMSFEQAVVREPGAPTLRVAAQEALPDPRLGRLVPNYILANLPSPTAMAAISLSLGLPGTPTSAEVAQNLPISDVALFVPNSVAANLVPPGARTSGAVLPPRPPTRISVAPAETIAGISAAGVSPLSVSLPAATLVPLRQGRAPELAALSLAPDDTIVPDAPLPFGAGAVGAQFQLTNVSLNAPASYDPQRLGELVASMRASGFPAKDPNLVNVAISKTNVRYFHSSDAAAAQALADIVGGQARNFTDYRPQPPQGTLEVWMAGRRNARPARPSGSSTGVSAEDRALQSLRNRLLQSLRDGDHL